VIAWNFITLLKVAATIYQFQRLNVAE